MADKYDYQFVTESDRKVFREKVQDMADQGFIVIEFKPTETYTADKYPLTKYHAMMQRKQSAPVLPNDKGPDPTGGTPAASTGTVLSESNVIPMRRAA